MSEKKRGRPPAGDEKRGRFELLLSPRERGMLDSLCCGSQASAHLRGLIAGAYHSARVEAQASAVEFLRLAALDPEGASIEAPYTQPAAWAAVRDVAATGDLRSVQLSMRLRVGDWSAVIPACPESYMD